MAIRILAVEVRLLQLRAARLEISCRLAILRTCLSQICLQRLNPLQFFVVLLEGGCVAISGRLPCFLRLLGELIELVQVLLLRGSSSRPR